MYDAVGDCSTIGITGQPPLIAPTLASFWVQCTTDFPFNDNTVGCCVDDNYPNPAFPGIADGGYSIFGSQTNACFLDPLCTCIQSLCN